MIRTLFFAAFAFALIGLSTGCDIIEGPKKDYSNVSANSTKRVLMEEFTGQTCGNCPSAHRTLRELDSIYGDNFIVVSVHAGGFATPIPPMGYPNDYRTVYGTELLDNFDADVFGLPNSLINRKKVNNEQLFRVAGWGSIIGTVLSEQPELGLEVESTFDSASRDLSISVDLEYYANGQPNDKLIVLLTEDSVISRQKDYTQSPEDINNYIQRHMLRAAISSGGILGEQISANPINTGDRINRTFTFTIDPAWSAKHCAVVAFVVRDEEVIQANEGHVRMN